MITLLSAFLSALALFLLIVWVALIDLDRLLSSRGFAVFTGLLDEWAEKRRERFLNKRVK